MKTIQQVFNFKLYAGYTYAIEIPECVYIKQYIIYFDPILAKAKVIVNKELYFLMKYSKDVNFIKSWLYSNIYHIAENTVTGHTILRLDTNSFSDVINTETQICIKYDLMSIEKFIKDCFEE